MRKYICMTENEREKLAAYGFMVIEFKQILRKLVDAFEILVKGMLETMKSLQGTLGAMKLPDAELPPREQYKRIRHLTKCGYSEKDIDVMVRYRRLCRDNC